MNNLTNDSKITIMNDKPKVSLKVQTKDTYIQLRLTPELKKALMDVADKNGVTVSRVIEYALGETFAELKEYLPKI